MPDLTGALSGCHAVVAQLSAQRPIARTVDPASQRHGIEAGVRHPMPNETFRFFTAARSPSSFQMTSGPVHCQAARVSSDGPKSNLNK